MMQQYLIYLYISFMNAQKNHRMQCTHHLAVMCAQTAGFCVPRKSLSPVFASSRALAESGRYSCVYGAAWPVRAAIMSAVRP